MNLRKKKNHEQLKQFKTLFFIGIIAHLCFFSCSNPKPKILGSNKENRDFTSDIASEESPLPGYDLPAPLEDLPFEFDPLDDYNWTSSVDQKVVASVFFGNISYYSNAFHGRKMANGERYYAWSHSCANKTLPFGTKLKITVQPSGKSVICKVTDRGPFGPGRIVDVSLSAAKQIGLLPTGVAFAKIEVVN